MDACLLGKIRERTQKQVRAEFAPTGLIVEEIICAYSWS